MHHYISGSFNEAIRDCAKNCTFSTAYAIHAASSVIGRPIRSFYPPINGLFDKSIGILNRDFNPRTSKSLKNPICLLWSNTQPFSGIGTWTPNHFVLMIPKNAKPTSIFDISNDSEFPPLPTKSDKVKHSTPVTKCSPNLSEQPVEISVDNENTRPTCSTPTAESSPQFLDQPFVEISLDNETIEETCSTPATKESPTFLEIPSVEISSPGHDLPINFNLIDSASSLRDLRTDDAPEVSEGPHPLHPDENEYDDAYQTADHNYALPGKSPSNMSESNSDIISESISESIPNEDIETVISPCPASPPENQISTKH